MRRSAKRIANERLGHRYALEAKPARERHRLFAFGLVAEACVERQTRQRRHHTEHAVSVRGGILFDSLHDRRRDAAARCGGVDEDAADGRGVSPFQSVTLRIAARS
jgi:hypothetical protein